MDISEKVYETLTLIGKLFKGQDAPLHVEDDTDNDSNSCFMQ